MYIVICFGCFVLGLFAECFLISSMINGKLTGRCSKLKFKRKDGRTQYLFGPDSKTDFAILIYSLNENIYGDVISEIDKED